MKRFLVKNKYFILLIIFAIIALIFSTGHYNIILLDVGREVYYPQRILEGKILYKDIFNIYGPFSYFFNAVLYKIFGAKLSTLYIAGSISAIGIISAIYLIAKKFLTGFLSFSIGFFTIAAGICAAHLFNFTFPYSWAMLYGTLAFLYSLLFLIKFRQDKSAKWLYISSFLGGIAFANKYDFFVYSIILLFIMLKTKDIKIILKSFLAFLSVPIILFGILFLQGLQVSDLINFIEFLKSMTESETLKYFYSGQGLYFKKETPIFMGIFFVMTSITFIGLVLSQKIKKNKLFSYIIFTICGIGIYLITNAAEFIFLPFLLTILSVIKFKKLLNHPKTFILIASALAVSLKTFWGLTYMNYGNYYISIILIALFSIMLFYMKKDFQKPAGIFLIITAVCVIVNYFKNQPDYQIKTEKGTIITSEYNGKASEELTQYINQHTKQTDSIVIFPEGLIVNFLTNRKSDDYYNSMLPLYTEVLGEEKIVEHFKNNAPEYFVFNNQNMKDYYFEYICRDYAVSFCKFVSGNYTQTAKITGGMNYLVYKRKK